MASKTLTMVGSGTDLSTLLHQVISWTNANLLLIGTLVKFESTYMILFKDNAFGNIICEIATILFRLQCIIDATCDSRWKDSSPFHRRWFSPAVQFGWKFILLQHHSRSTDRFKYCTTHGNADVSCATKWTDDYIIFWMRGKQISVQF